MFYRFIRENFANYIEGGDGSVNYARLPDKEIPPAVVDDAIKTKGYFINPSDLFVNIADSANTNESLNTDLASIFTAIEASANGYPSEKGRRLKAQGVRHERYQLYGATAGRSAINKMPLTTKQHCGCLEIDNTKAVCLYIFQLVRINHENIKALGQCARGDLNSSIIKNFKLPIPYVDAPEKSLAEQTCIVFILDKFNALTHFITEGLPREIELTPSLPPPSQGEELKGLPLRRRQA